MASHVTGDDNEGNGFVVPTPTVGSDAKIQWQEAESEQIEIIIDNIPNPVGYYMTSKRKENSDHLERHIAARWVVQETLKILSEYDTKPIMSDNDSLRAIRFTCRKTDFPEVLMKAIQFVNSLEMRRKEHAEQYIGRVRDYDDVV